MDIDASGLEEPSTVVVEAASVTAGQASNRGTVVSSIEARLPVPWLIDRNGTEVPVELIRIVPSANMVEVDEDADQPTTTSGLLGYKIRITQTSGRDTYSVEGTIGQGNLVSITDAALDSLAAGRETTITIASELEEEGAAGQSGGAPQGSIRFRGSGLDSTVTNGVWSGTHVPTAGATGASTCATEYCTAVKIYSCWKDLCVWITVISGPGWGLTCMLVCGWVTTMNCWYVYGTPLECA